MDMKTKTFLVNNLMTSRLSNASVKCHITEGRLTLWNFLDDDASLNVDDYKDRPFISIVHPLESENLSLLMHGQYDMRCTSRNELFMYKEYFLISNWYQSWRIGLLVARLNMLRILRWVTFIM
jgi:hypothetical protein